MSLLTDVIQKSSKLVGDNSTTILTVIGVSGTITTAYLTGKASVKAAEMLKEEQEKVSDQEPHRLNDKGQMKFQDKVKKVWPVYIPPVAVGTLTIASIITANQIASKKMAALAVASTVSERAFQEYRDKVVEKLGEKKEVAIRDEVAQDRVSNTPLTKEVLVVGAGEVLCFDLYTGRYFQSTVEKIRQAENKINYEILNHMYASLSRFYDLVGIPPTQYSDDVGWNGLTERFEIRFSTVLSPDQRPCIAVEFAHPPMPEYTKLY
jgi:hypothetical protein